MLRKARGSVLRHFHRGAHWVRQMRESSQVAWFETRPAGQVSQDKTWADGGMRTGGADHQQARMAVSVFHAQSLLTRERKIR